MVSTTCKHYRLASSGSCEIWVCADCGTTSVNLGSVTMRFQQVNFEIVLETMQVAMEQLTHNKIPNPISLKPAENKARKKLN